MAGKSKKKKSRKPENTGFLKDELIVWLTLAVSILILLSNFGLGGFVGDGISKALTKLFGWVAYAVPFVLFGIVSFLISNRGKALAIIKTISIIILMIFCCTLLQLVNDLGGVVGKVIAKLLTPAIGVAGTYAIILIGIIICLVIITGKSAISGVKKQSGKAYSKAKEDAKKRKAAAEERRREREDRTTEENMAKPRRSDRHVEGVSFDTTIRDTNPKEPVDSPQQTKTEPVNVEVKEEPQFVINRPEAPALQDEEPEEMSTEVEEKKPARSKPAKMSEKEAKKEVDGVNEQVESEASKPKAEYKVPPLALLKKGKRTSGQSDAYLRETAMKLQQTLQTFGVKATVTNVSCGPAVTRYELQPEMGVKVSKIVGLADDIKLNLAATDIRIEAPIPGKAAVGIEVPNKENSSVTLRDLLETPEFQNSSSKISFAAGKDIGGKTVVADIAKMPHVLIAGATGSGKSVCINTLIMSILYKATPDEVKLIMIDPKVVELSVYNGIPHLMIPVVTDPKKAAGALNWAVAEMTRRYQAFTEFGVRDMKGYNEKIKHMPEVNGVKPQPMPQLVIIVDELADLMMVAPGDVESAICRLAQLARAAGIHLVLATQRPSVDVITGLIKANMPSRIAFSVTSGVDSRTIIDMNGAEKLLGKGDMLFYPSGYQKPVRVQGAFVSDEEVEAVVDFFKNHTEDVSYDETIINQVNTASVGSSGAFPGGSTDERDAYFADAGALIIEKEKASIGMLQRTFKIGFNRAARIMDQLCEAGVVGGEEGTKPRKVLMTQDEFEQYLNDN